LDPTVLALGVIRSVLMDIILLGVQRGDISPSQIVSYSWKRY